MEFEVQSSNTTIEDFAAYWLGFRWKQPGKKPPKQVSRRTQTALNWVMLLGGVLLLVLNLRYREYSTPYTTLFCLAISALGLFTVIRGTPEYPYWVQRAWKNYQKHGEAYTYRFTPEGFEIHGKTSDHRYDYSLLQQLWEDEGHFYLFLDQPTPFMLNKTGFTQGGPEAFPAFLQEKTGKPIQWVNGKRKQIL